jgi:four helix bundle protein
MAFKFEKLEIWQLAKDLAKAIYVLINQLPSEEQFNLSSQIRRAVTSISLNIAEGSTSQNDPEQLRFLSYAHRSLMEVVACLILINENKYINQATFNTLYSDSEKLSAKILAMKNAIRKRLTSNYVNEETENYGI